MSVVNFSLLSFWVIVQIEVQTNFWLSKPKFFNICKLMANRNLASRYRPYLGTRESRINWGHKSTNVTRFISKRREELSRHCSFSKFQTIWTIFCFHVKFLKLKRTAGNGNRQIWNCLELSAIVLFYFQEEDDFISDVSSVSLARKNWIPTMFVFMDLNFIAKFVWTKWRLQKHRRFILTLA